MSDHKINWYWRTFSELSSSELYDILACRSKVFQIEQECLYFDLDGMDEVCWHGYGLKDNKLCAAVRLRLYQEKVKIERVVTPKHCRGQGIGRLLMAETLSFIKSKYPGQGAVLSAQYGLKDYYADFGFKPVGEPFDDIGIKHIMMEKMRDG